MKQALEALAASDDFLFNYHDCEPNNEREMDAYSEIRANNHEAFMALRTAIEQAEKRWSEFNETTKRNIEHADWYLSTHSAPEPVGVVKVLPLGDGHKPMHWSDWTDDDNHPPEGTLLYTTPPAAPVQEPVAQSMIKALTHAVEIAEAKRPGTWDDLLQYRALLATPSAAQRQWVGLTDEEVDHTEWIPKRGSQITYDIGWLDNMRIFARALEAKLKEKNT